MLNGRAVVVIVSYTKSSCNYFSLQIYFCSPQATRKYSMFQKTGIVKGTSVLCTSEWVWYVRCLHSLLLLSMVLCNFVYFSLLIMSTVSHGCFFLNFFKANLKVACVR